ncbi:hypothetical protein JCM8097_007133 [Rhodosporidiobolus ruineniae]
MADNPRPAFRPQRGRASLSALPSSTALPAALSLNPPADKENGSTSLAQPVDAAQVKQHRKKRAQSLGGEALEGARKRLKDGAEGSNTTSFLELFPGKMDRRKAMPRRSILKQAPLFGADNHTISFPPSRASLGGASSTALSGSHTVDLSSLAAFKQAVTTNTAANGTTSFSRRRSSLRPRASIAPSTGYDDSDASEDEDDDPNGSLDMDVTRFETTAAYDGDGRRKSTHSRRVSFAPAAHIRTYTPDKMTADAQAFNLAAQAHAAAQAVEPITGGSVGDDSFSSSSSMSFSDDGLLNAAPSTAEATEGADDYADEPSMEISREMLAGTGGGTGSLRFGGHFAGTNVPTGALGVLTGSGIGGDDSADEDADEDGTMAMDEVTTDGVTSAFAPYEMGGFNSQAVHQRAQQEDAGVSTSTSWLYPSLASLSSAPPAEPASTAQLQLFGAAPANTAAGASSKPRPRFSEVAREEDDDDEAILRELGFAKGGKPRKSRLPRSSLAPAVAEQQQQPASKPRPRFSEVARQEDDDDEAILRELGFAKGGKPRKSRVARPSFAPSTVAEEDDDEMDEDDEEMEMSTEEMEDATGAMEFTTAVGGVLSASQNGQHPVDQQQQAGDDEDDVDSDAEVSMQLTNNFDRTVDMTFASSINGGDGDADDLSRLDAESEPSMDQTMDATATMAEATTYGGILSQSLLTRPEPVFPSFSLSASTTQSVAARAASPPKSPGRALRALTPTGSGSTLAPGPGAPTQSPFRRRSLVASSPRHNRRSSPLPSPRRVPSVSPAPPATEEVAAAALPASQERARSRSASPTKYAAPSSLAVPVPKSPRARQSISPVPASRSRSASPVKQPSPLPSSSSQPLGLATPAKAVFNPRTLAPPQSAGRSPGGSLSLRALLSADAAESPAQKRVEELRMQQHQAMGGEEELNLTGSEFDSSFESGANLPAPPASLDSFLAQTGVSFVDDIVTLAGVDLAQGRRRSMAPAGGMVDGEQEKESGPPTFADMAVAGAVNSLFYQLYQSDQQRLHEGIQEAQHIYAQHEEAVQAASDAEKPLVFRQWAGADDQERAKMQTGFGQIKLYYRTLGEVEWKVCRAENYRQIIHVMEQNLEGLKEDRTKLAQVDVASVIPDLEARHAALLAELNAEQALDKELSGYNAEDLALLQELQEGMEEQDEQLNGNPSKGLTGRRPERDRLEEQLKFYESTRQRYAAEEDALETEIKALEERRRDKRTKADLVRLQADFDALARVHGWELVRFSAAGVVLYAWDEFELTLEFVPGSLNVGAVGMELLDPKGKKQGELGVSAEASGFLLAKIYDEVVRQVEEKTPDARSLIRYVSHRAAIARHIRHEITLTALRYPTKPSRTIGALTANVDKELHVIFDVFCPSARLGFDVEVHLTADQVVEPATAKDWATDLTVHVRQQFGRFGGTLDALGLEQGIKDSVVPTAEGSVSLVEAIRAAEEACEAAA